MGHPGHQRWSEVGAVGARILVNPAEPVAVIRRPDGTDQVAAWPDLDVGRRAPTATVLGAPTGMWVFYRPSESEDPTVPGGTPAAVHVGWDGATRSFTDLTHHQPVGVTRHGLWLTSENFPDPQDAEAWRAASTADVLAPDGNRRRVQTDRRIAFALDDGDVPRLVLYDEVPLAIRSFGSTSFTYRYAGAALPPDALPDGMRAAELDLHPWDEQRLLAVMSAVAPREADGPPGDPGIRWSRIALATADQEAAVASVVREFAHLAEYWRSPDGRTSPLAAGLGDPLVEVIGGWPQTRVEVSFTHPHYPGGRLRRTLRVFDDAGRVASWMYASIHLMEDLDTLHLPAASSARDGYLEI